MGSIGGYIVEVIFTLVTKGVFINHSALVIGPFDVAYGLGAILLTALLEKYRDSSWPKIFFLGFVGGSILEYIMSWGMELVLGFTAWDYSQRFLNINGRICLLYSLYWGILAIIWIKFIYPIFLKIVNKFQNNVGKKVTVIMVIFIILDTGLTISAIYRAKEKDKGINATNKYEEILDKTFNREYLDNMFCGNWGE